VIRMRKGLGKSRACKIEDGSKTALFSPLRVEARFRLALGQFRSSSLAEAWASTWICSSPRD
jgi:hypothetical protein